MKKGNIKTVKRSFYINISLIVVTIIAVLLVTFFSVMFFYIRSLYIETIQRETVDVNKFVAAQIDGNKIEEYSKNFNKDDYYYELNSMLYRLKEIFSIKYLYIMADIGGPDAYTYIFDAVYDEETGRFDDSQYGKTEPKSVFPGGDRVFQTGRSFDEAGYSETEEYGRLFYSYAPIVNSKGDVVAFLGTDISADEMFQSINSAAATFLAVGIAAFILSYIAVMLYCKQYISKPLIKLSADITGFSEGELDIEISDKLLNRKDELGLIYRSFSSVISTIGNLIGDLHQTADNVIEGRINAQSGGENRYWGSYENIKESINLLLDNTRKIFNLMPVYFFIHDYDYTLLYSNTPAKSLIGTDSTDSTESRESPESSESIEKEIVTRTREALRENFCMFARNHDENMTGSFSLALSDATVRHYNYFLIKNNPREETKNICCVLTDVTDYVEMSKKALASSVAKSEFLSKMSHEIRTPMNAIIGMTEIAARQTDPDKIMESLDNIKISSSHLLTIINDILDISKIESGKIEIVNLPFDLNKLIGDVSALASKLASDKEVILKTELIHADTDTNTGTGTDTENNAGLHSNMMFLGDEVRIKQVLINLVSNAAKFSPKGSTVYLTARFEPAETKNKTKICFSVKDSGIGIAPEKLESIFEAFEQGGSDITRKFGGTGLGLPISNSLVQLMGGEKINVESEPGKGSLFWFYLEFENSGAESRESETETEADISVESVDFTGKRLMVVDDIEMNRQIVMFLLEGTGIEITECDDGSVALREFSDSPENYYDMIFMDIQMKIMDGYAASKGIRSLIRKDSSKVKIIAMSANAFQTDMELAFEAGMDDYIVKPIDSNIMLKKMKKYL